MSELYHHGVKGMRWGVRRYQNYDGSYTRKGMEHYRKAESDYNESRESYKKAKADYKSARKTFASDFNGDKSDKSSDKILSSKKKYKEAKANMKEAQRVLSLKYDQLKRDKAGDKGKKLYQSGKTITSNNELIETIAQVSFGFGAASWALSKYGGVKYSRLAVPVAMAGAGLDAGLIALAGKNMVEAKYLRAYYGHSRNNY